MLMPGVRQARVSLKRSTSRPRRSLESELAACRSQLQEAREDLERDEVIFADKMKELAVGTAGRLLAGRCRFQGAEQ